MLIESKIDLLFATFKSLTCWVIGVGQMLSRTNTKFDSSKVLLYSASDILMYRRIYVDIYFYILDSFS